MPFDNFVWKFFHCWCQNSNGHAKNSKEKNSQFFSSVDWHFPVKMEILKTLEVLYFWLKNLNEIRACLHKNHGRDKNHDRDVL